MPKAESGASMGEVDLEKVRKRLEYWRSNRGFYLPMGLRDDLRDAIQLADEARRWRIVAEEYLDQTGRLRKETTQLVDELQDIRDSERIILDEKCASDEVHCGCVPTLRREIERLREALGELIGWCKTYMEYHSKKRAENGCGSATGLWPAITAAEAALHTDPSRPRHVPEEKEVGGG